VRAERLHVGETQPPGSISVRGAWFRYGSRQEPAIRDVSFDLAAGECLLVLGPSGSGKSTLALALAGLVPGDTAGEWRGTVAIDGLDTVRSPRPLLASRVGLVFQDPRSQLVMEWTDDEVAFGLENRAWSRRAMLARVPEALAEVGLLEPGRRRSRTLSGGQQQRLALADVLAPRPGILVLDEPTSNLDPATATRFLERLAAIVRERRTTVVLVEHRVDAVWPLADRVLALDGTGGVLAFGRPDEVLAEHARALDDAGIWLPAMSRTRSAPPAAGTADHLEPAPSAIPTRSRAGEAAPEVRCGFAPGPTPGVRAGFEPERPQPTSRLVEASGLAFAYPGSPLVLRDIELVISPGQRVAVLGPNGSGKSTLAKLLVGLLRPSDGEVRLDGDRPDRLAPRELARRAGYVFQDPELQFLADRVRDEIAVGLPRPALADAEALVESLGLPLQRLGDASPYSLSGGEQRRLSVACALVRRPRLLVLDEPTYGLDRHGWEALVQILRERIDAGTALVVVTHDLRFAATMADRAIVLAAGIVAYDGPMEALLDDDVLLRRWELAA
jgi:energy-coupling factor transport system ATP-binding protein